MSDKTLRKAAEKTLKLLDERIWRNDSRGYKTKEQLRAALLADSADAPKGGIKFFADGDEIAIKRPCGCWVIHGLGQLYCDKHNADAPEGPEGPWKVRNHDEIDGYYEVYNHHDFDIPRLTLQSKPQATGVCNELNRLDAQQKK